MYTIYHTCAWLGLDKYLNDKRYPVVHLYSYEPMSRFRDHVSEARWRKWSYFYKTTIARDRHLPANDYN